jgi:hypothetical protein
LRQGRYDKKGREPYEAAGDVREKNFSFSPGINSQIVPGVRIQKREGILFVRTV